MKKLKVGVVGVGDISTVYIPNLKKYDLIEVTACAGADLEESEQKGEGYGIPERYASGRELIEESDVDIVLDLTPPSFHGEYNLLAVQAGKNVYSEKPLAGDVGVAKQIVAEAEKRNLVVGSAPDTFLGGRLQTCRRLLDEGAIGDIVGAGAWVISPGHEWHHPNPGFFYKSGAGPLLDMGPYYVVALISLLGPVRSCAGMARRMYDTRKVMFGDSKGKNINVEVDTHIAGTVRFESGAIASIVVSFDVWDSQLPRLEVYGSEGTICIPDVDPLDGPNLFGGPVWLMRAKNARWRGMPRQSPLPEWEQVPVLHKFNETSHRENSRGIGLVDMAYAIRDGRAPRASGRMGLHVVETMNAILDSARTGEFVNVSSTTDRPDPLPQDFPESEG